MGAAGFFNRAKGAFTQAKRAATENPDAVRSGIGKAERFVNDKTGGKYAQAVSKGKEGLQGALGVTETAKTEFEAERAKETHVDPIKADPIDKPSDIGRPDPL